MLTRILLTAASVVALSAAANAADMYRAPAAMDTPYIGVNWNGFYFGVNGGYGEDNNTTDWNGAFGGGQVGFNMQRGSFVFGVEGDLQGSSIKAPNNAEIDYFGTIRARAGFAAGNALFYGTGGYGAVHCKGCVSDSVDGWVLGGGIEYKLNPAWSLKGEYQFLDYTSFNSDEGLNTIRLGLNYHVGSSHAPLK
jgi:outer membrane immunogenic protein